VVLSGAARSGSKQKPVTVHQNNVLSIEHRALMPEFPGEIIVSVIEHAAPVHCTIAELVQIDGGHLDKR